MKESKQKGADIAHFPELALSGYAGVDFNSFENYDWDELHRQTDSILELAKELEIWVILGSSHRLAGDVKPFDCVYIISREGKIVDRYDKRFCTEDDLKYYSPGDHFVTFNVHGLKCGVLICYDIRFPELYRQYCLQEVQVLFQSFYNARQKSGSIHPKIMPVTSQARAATNHFYMSITNSSAKHTWPAHFITPDGLIESKLPLDKPGVLISHVDSAKRYYDASEPFRVDAIKGKLNSGTTVDRKYSKDRTSH